MNIHNVVVHLIEKSRHQNHASLRLRDAELEIDQKVKNLLTRIDELYRKRSGRAYGNFSPAPFNTALKTYLSEPSTFVAFSQVAMHTLEKEIVRAPLATGGYVLFSRFENANQSQFVVVMLKDTEGVSFDSNLDVLDVNHLELDNLHLAANIDLNRWQLGSASGYVSFVKGRHNAAVTEYFKRFIGIDEFSDSATDTAGLIVAVRSYAQGLGLNEQDTEKLKLRVHAYCADRLTFNSPIYIDELSRHLDEANPEAFLQHVNAGTEQVNAEISLDDRGLRKLVKYSGRDSEMSIVFEGALLGNRVRYDAKSDTLTIKGIPRKLREQLTYGSRE